MILITGASSGIGEACARLLASQKRDLILIARRQLRLNYLARELKSKYKITVHVIPLDVSKRKAVEDFLKSHSSKLKKVDTLINCAGGAWGIDPIHLGKVDDWERMIDTNLKGTLYMIRGILPHMVSQKRGHIVNMGSVAGRTVYPKGNIYCASKFAVHALTESLKMDLLGHPIKVTEIMPAMVETEFSIVRLGDAKKAKEVYQGMTPLTAADIAEAVVWSLNRPSHVNIQEMVIYPVDQALPGMVHRRS